MVPKVPFVSPKASRMFGPESEMKKVWPKDDRKVRANPRPITRPWRTRRSRKFIKSLKWLEREYNPDHGPSPCNVEGPDRMAAVHRPHQKTPKARRALTPRVSEP